MGTHSNDALSGTGFGSTLGSGSGSLFVVLATVLGRSDSVDQFQVFNLGTNSEGTQTIYLESSDDFLV